MFNIYFNNVFQLGFPTREEAEAWVTDISARTKAKGLWLQAEVEDFEIREEA